MSAMSYSFELFASVLSLYSEYRQNIGYMFDHDTFDQVPGPAAWITSQSMCHFPNISALPTYPGSQGGFWIFCQVPQEFSYFTNFSGTKVFYCQSFNIFSLWFYLAIYFLKLYEFTGLCQPFQQKICISIKS